MTRIAEPPPTAARGAGGLPQAVPPPSALGLTLHPSLATGRREARYGAVVTNSGARPISPRISIEERGARGGHRLRATIATSAAVLGPGERCHAEIVLRARRARVLRGEHEHTVSVRVRGDGESDRAEGTVVFVQGRALSLVWTCLALVALAAAAAAGLRLLPSSVTVPAVLNAPDAATAEQALTAAGLTLDPRLRSRTVAGVRPGTVLDQIPSPGARAERGTAVSLLVAIGARRATTPVLRGRTPAQAAKLLLAAGLTAGPLRPAGAAPSWVVASQLPAAGARVPVGTAVTLVVRAPGPGDEGAAPPAGAPAPAAAGEPPVVPQIEGRSLTAYASAVVAAGLVPKVTRVVDTAPLGTLVGVEPKAGVLARPGEDVRLLVSAGVPQIGFDTGDVVRVFDPRSGRTLRQASPPQGKAVEPSWSADGRELLYRVGRRLQFVSARLSQRGRTVYDGRTKYAVATLAPSRAADVVALVRRTGGDGDLCFARIGQSRLRPRCAADPRWDLGRQISWRPDGRELLVFGVRRGRPGTFGILRYRSSKAFSTNPAHWRGRPATDISVKGHGAIAASYAPSGTRVALVSNSGRSRFQLVVTGARDLRGVAPALPVRACEVAWRPDGKELAVVQSDDACGKPVGAIVRLDPKRPRETVTVSSGGRHPTYQPLTYAGPKGLS